MYELRGYGGAALRMPYSIRFSAGLAPGGFNQVNSVAESALAAAFSRDLMRSRWTV